MNLWKRKGEFLAEVAATPAGKARAEDPAEAQRRGG